MMGKDILPDLVLVSGIISDVFPPWLWIVSSCSCTDNFFPEYQDNPLQISRVLFLCNSLLFGTLYIEFQQLYCSCSPNFISSIQEIRWSPHGYYLLCHFLRRLFKAVNKRNCGLTSFVLHCLGITVIYLLMSKVLKINHCFIYIFCVFEGEGLFQVGQ